MTTSEFLGGNCMRCFRYGLSHRECVQSRQADAQTVWRFFSIAILPDEAPWIRA